MGAKGLIWVKCNEDGSYKSSVDNFFNQKDLAEWSKITNAHAGDLIFVMAGDSQNTQTQLSALRIEIAQQMGLRKSNEFAGLWVTDFPLLAWDEDSKDTMPCTPLHRTKERTFGFVDIRSRKSIG